MNQSLGTAVLGAGPAGLTAAYTLGLRGLPAAVFEADGTVGGIAKTVVTDTVPLPDHERDSAIEVLSMAPLLAEAIMRIHKGLSISALFS